MKNQKWQGAAAICINQKGQLLMVLQGKPDEVKTWSVPSGERHKSESFIECCMREVKEETGYDVSIMTELFCKEHENYEVHYFLAIVVGGIAQSQDPDGLIYDVKWVSHKNISTKKLTYPGDQEVLNAYINKPLFQSTRLYLRECREEDWLRIHSYASDPQVSRYQYWNPQTEVQSQAYVTQIMEDAEAQPRDRYALAIVENDTHQCIGVGELSIRDRRNRVGELAYGLHPDYWGKGYATEAAEQLLSFGFLERKLHRIYATSDPRNKGSERVMQKLGMRKEGLLRETILLDEGWRDSLMYSVLEHEFMKKHDVLS